MRFVHWLLWTWSVVLTAAQVLEPDGDFFNVNNLGNVCPGTYLPPAQLSEDQKLFVLNQTLVDRFFAGCFHIHGNLEYDLSTKKLVVAFSGGEDGTVGYGSNITRTISGYLYVRVGDYGELRFVDMYGLTYIAGGNKWNGCDLVLEYASAKSSNWSGGFRAETLDLKDLQICSFRSELENGQWVRKSEIVKTVLDGTTGGGIKITNMSESGVLTFDEMAGLAGKYVFQYDKKCIARQRTSIIANFPGLKVPDGDECCPEECEHGCVYELNPLKGGEGLVQTRCIAYSALLERFCCFSCEICDLNLRIGLVCIKSKNDTCDAPFVRSENNCAFECPFRQTLNMVDGSCVPCAWSFENGKFDTGKESCDTSESCAVMGSVNYATTSEMKRSDADESRACRIMTGNVDITPSTLVKTEQNSAITDQLSQIPAFYGNVRVRGLGGAVELLKSTVQIVGIDLGSLKKLGGKKNVGDNPGFDPGAEQKLDADLIRARDSAKNQGLLPFTSEMNATADCYEGCAGNCNQSLGKASWGCTQCNDKALIFNQPDLFSCAANATECPSGYYKNGTQCVLCDPSCVGGCSGKGSNFGANGCNKCSVYVFQKDGTCRTVAFRFSALNHGTEQSDDRFVCSSSHQFALQRCINVVRDSQLQKECKCTDEFVDVMSLKKKKNGATGENPPDVADPSGIPKAVPASAMGATPGDQPVTGASQPPGDTNNGASPAPAASPAPVDGPKAPAGGGMAGTHDPNYQTLAGMGPEVFGADKKAPAAAPAQPAVANNGPKAPAVGGIAGSIE
ncbi:hypothetical protein M3Y96_01159500 [Aphelenchoides besseyi]|nr:hypothetical protein M3Y96_01159500 [Aphelenchoides besseyi]